MSASSTQLFNFTCARLLASQFVKGDITSADLVLHLLKEEAIDTVMNFAAQARCACLRFLAAGSRFTLSCLSASFTDARGQ